VDVRYHQEQWSSSDSLGDDHDISKMGVDDKFKKNGLGEEQVSLEENSEFTHVTKNSENCYDDWTKKNKIWRRKLMF